MAMALDSSCMFLCSTEQENQENQAIKRSGVEDVVACGAQVTIRDVLKQYDGEAQTVTCALALRFTIVTILYLLQTLFDT